MACYFHQTFTLHEADHGIGADDGVYVRSPCRCHRSRGYAGADERRVIGLKSAAHQHIGRHEMGARAGRGDADGQSFQALGPAVGDGFRCDRAEHESGIAPVLRDGYDRLAFGLHLDGVIEGADAHLGTAADERLQGAAAALHISDFDLEASVAEMAEPLGDRERQIEDCRFAADSQPHLRHFRFVLCAGRAHQRGCGNRDDGGQGMLHRCFLADSTLDLMPTNPADRTAK